MYARSWTIEVGKQHYLLGSGARMKISAVHRAMCKSAQVNHLKIKGKYVSIHSSPVSEMNHSSRNYVPLKMLNAPLVRPK